MKIIVSQLWPMTLNQQSEEYSPEESELHFGNSSEEEDDEFWLLDHEFEAQFDIN